MHGHHGSVRVNLRVAYDEEVQSHRGSRGQCARGVHLDEGRIDHGVRVSSLCVPCDDRSHGLGGKHRDGLHHGAHHGFFCEDQHTRSRDVQYHGGS